MSLVIQSNHSIEEMKDMVEKSKFEDIENIKYKLKDFSNFGLPLRDVKLFFFSFYLKYIY